MFERILVAVADDALAAGVLSTAASLSERLNAQVALVEVVDLASASALASGPVDSGISPIAFQDLVEDQEASGRAFLDRAVASFPQGKVETLLREGLPAGEIVAAARDWHAELIVVGTHGRSGLGRLVLGSVAEEVLRHAPCPVLVVPQGPDPA